MSGIRKVSCARRDHREAKKRSCPNACPQIFAALMQEDDISYQYCQRKDLTCRMHLCRLENCTCDLINFIDDCLS